VIVGQIVEMKNGVYTIQSDSVGQIQVAADKILEISSPSLGSDSSTPEVAILDGSKSSAKKPRQKAVSPGSDDITRQQEEVNARVKSMTMNGDFLDSMMDLGESSSMMDVMNDPEIMEAISRNDFDFLMNSDKMKNLMDSDEIKDLLGDVEP
ncbi:MAG: hypothetical protein PHV05_10120, partial [Candidatus Riflebacteria bacterium]|nr:hypothetical protein [Candidatus Riflebacteria bacterium]